ncbi:putative invertase inhibitor [Panicum miliaceum]|uniref:Invertase inhibitor n=1 Tax=Panicum miliaceum TaxID=4540 RepID=A0A3L6RMB5_PANMI|nr:putative invertase inhibitor [Panicum miliaceum]
MRQSMSSLISALAIVAILVLHSVDASTVEATCKAAAESDKHVINEFCVQELSKHTLTAPVQMPGVWPSALQTKAGTDDKTLDVLLQCQAAYTDVEYSFSRARNEISLRNYAEGKEAVGIATKLVKSCEGRFAKAKVQSPVAAHNWYSEQIATICMAITNLIK